MWYITFSDPPRLIIQPNNLTVVEGNGFELQCSGIGLPIFDVTWYKNKELITSISSAYSDASTSSRTATLIISSANITDEGFYQCLLANPLGLVTSAASWVDVHRKFSNLCIFLKSNVTGIF